MAVPLEDRFWAKVEKAGPDECWLWTGGRGSGYGVFNWRQDGRTIGRGAHRLAYEFSRGPIPIGWEIDHRSTCSKLCVNPGHLRVTTRKQNQENLQKGHNPSGVRGVTFTRGAWQAQVGHNGRTVYLGRYRTAEEAGEAARAKRLELFTHNDADRIEDVGR